MAEKQAEHLQNIQNKITTGYFKETGRGQIMAFILGILGILCAAYLGIKGHGFVGVGLGIIGVSSMMSQFIVKRKK